jgi:steroid delta-isomerase-like uncharacterized protein
MTTHANKELVQRYIELYNSGNVAIADEIIAPDFVDHEHPECEPGPTAVKRMVTDFRAAFPDATGTVQEIIAERDMVAFRFVLRGTHSGPAHFAGLPPSGRGITLVGMDFVRITNGKLVELWSCQDTLGLLQQLGAIASGGQ